MEISFKKKGAEIKSAIENRLKDLESRMKKRNQVLDKIISNPKKIRSYIIRHSRNEGFGGHGGYGGSPVLFSNDHISSEEVEEITQLCRRVFELEQEINTLKMVYTHLASEETFQLSQTELVSYGFDIDK